MSKPALEVKEMTTQNLWELADSRLLYAILDACDAEAVAFKMKELGEEVAVCLYGGKAAQDYWDFAPYLARVDRDLLGWIADNLWEERWGFFAVTMANLKALRYHFRHFTFVRLPDGQVVYFRYYDPDILSTFLENATAAELTRFFGPVRAFIVPRVENETVLLRGYMRPSLGPLPAAEETGMLPLRTEMLVALGSEAKASFVERVVAHVREALPKQFRVHGEDAIRELAREGIDKAQQYGFGVETDVCKFIDVMILLGRDFDHDPRFPWARELLLGDLDREVAADSLLAGAVMQLPDEDIKGRAGTPGTGHT